MMTYLSEVSNTVVIGEVPTQQYRLAKLADEYWGADRNEGLSFAPRQEIMLPEARREEAVAYAARQVHKALPVIKAACFGQSPPGYEALPSGALTPENDGVRVLHMENLHISEPGIVRHLQPEARAAHLSPDALKGTADHELDLFYTQKPLESGASEAVLAALYSKHWVAEMVRNNTSLLFDSRFFMPGVLPRDTFNSKGSNHTVRRLDIAEEESFVAQCVKAANTITPLLVRTVRPSQTLPELNRTYVQNDPMLRIRTTEVGRIALER